METNLIRILLLVALFFLLSSDYSVFLKHMTEDDDDDGDSDVQLNTHMNVENVQESDAKSKEDEHALNVARKKIINAVKNSCLPKLICELNAATNKDTLSPSEISLLNLIRDTSIGSTAEVTSKYHFAAHMGQLISGLEGTGCHNFYPDCPLPAIRVSQMMKNVRFTFST